MAKRWTEDLGAWASSLRFSGFTVLIVGLVIVGALIVSPTLSTFVQQQREIAALRESVQQHRERVNEVDAERARWQDPAYVRAQARGRLFYVMPGETQLSVISDIVIPEDSTEETSDKLTQITDNWAQALVRSALLAATTDANPEQLTVDPALGTTGSTQNSNPPAEAPADTPAEGTNE